MDRKKFIFKRFVELNGLTEIVDFFTKTRQYSGSVGILTLYGPLTEAELQNSFEFMAFVDGYECRPSRMRGVAQEDADIFKRMRDELAKVGVTMLPEYSESGKQRYEQQYQLGTSARSSSPI